MIKMKQATSWWLFCSAVVMLGCGIYLVATSRSCQHKHKAARYKCEAFDNIIESRHFDHDTLITITPLPREPYFNWPTPQPTGIGTHGISLAKPTGTPLIRNNKIVWATPSPWPTLDLTNATLAPLSFTIGGGFACDAPMQIQDMCNENFKHGWCFKITSPLQPQIDKISDNLWQITFAQP